MNNFYSNNNKQNNIDVQNNNKIHNNHLNKSKKPRNSLNNTLIVVFGVFGEQKRRPLSILKEGWFFSISASNLKFANTKRSQTEQFISLGIILVSYWIVNRLNTRTLALTECRGQLSPLECVNAASSGPVTTKNGWISISPTFHER